MLFKLIDKVVLITGAAQGIGKGIAELFSEAGATCILTDINDKLGNDVAASIPNARYIHLDVRKEDDWQKVLEGLQAEGLGLDILVNNAGITGFQEGFGPQDPENASLEEWHKIHQVNLDGTFLGCKYAIQKMKDRGGAIINISSRSGLVGIPGAAAYASSKAAVRNHTKTVALHCAGQGYPVRCNSIHPAAILTPMWDPMLGEGKQRDAMMKEIVKDCPLQIMGEPIDVAAGALYLASDAAKYVTGIELNIDGGILAGSAASPQKADDNTKPVS
ncbi:MAG: Cyclopentanol dehydrogenase [Chlamydiales bacterium]|nr:Cyclopentanol dehydrogenase [Chlamydiales bacterium]